MRNLSKVAIIVLIAGIVLVLFAPYLFTRAGIISFKETGTIGDTIGGITAPITSLIGSILVFLALRAQIVANEIIQGQIEDQIKDDKLKKELAYISDLYKHLQDNINAIQFDKSKGVGAVLYILNTFAQKEPAIAHRIDSLSQGRLAEYYGVLKLTKLFVQQVNKATIDQSDKEYFKELIKHHIESFVSPYLDKNIAACSLCDTIHNGIPLEISSLVKEINELI